VKEAPRGFWLCAEALVKDLILSRSIHAIKPVQPSPPSSSLSVFFFSFQPIILRLLASLALSADNSGPLGLLYRVGFHLRLPRLPASSVLTFRTLGTNLSTPSVTLQSHRHCHCSTVNKHIRFTITTIHFTLYPDLASQYSSTSINSMR
jgi:hypothetical protein